MKNINLESKCVCGSGKKIKDCCYKSISEAMAKMKRQIAEGKEEEKRRTLKYGAVKKTISENFHGKKIVGVGSTLFVAEGNQTFHDFLNDFLKLQFGKGWWSSESKKPTEQRHPIVKLAFLKYEYEKLNSKKVGDLFEIDPDGPTNEWFSIAYDLYILRHHISLQKSLVKRMKFPDHFKSARYEAYVAAVMIKAGFKLVYEDETDGKQRHPEFTAEHIKTGIKCSVEAKQRNRQTPLSIDEWNAGGVSSLGIKHLVKDAIGKDQGLPYILFVDVGTPPFVGNPFSQSWSQELFDLPFSQGARDTEGKDLFNMVVYTNRPFEYTVGTPPRDSQVAAISKTPRRKIPEDLLLGIYNAIKIHGNIPNTF